MSEPTDLYARLAKATGGMNQDPRDRAMYNAIDGLRREIRELRRSLQHVAICLAIVWIGVVVHLWSSHP